MSEVKLALIRLALQKEAEKQKTKTVTYLGVDNNLHTVEEGEIVRVEPKVCAASG